MLSSFYDLGYDSFLWGYFLGTFGTGGLGLFLIEGGGGTGFDLDYLVL